jgi:hypothetical protein
MTFPVMAFFAPVGSWRNDTAAKKHSRDRMAIPKYILKMAVQAVKEQVLDIGDVMRILGLDYGEKRIGIAVSDELGLTAQGLETLQRKNAAHDVERIGKIARDLGVEKIVVGYPIRLNGEEGIQ